MSGLAPTLIIVRVAHGKSVDSVPQMASIHFAERETQPWPITSAVQATVDILPRTGVETLRGNDAEVVKPEQSGFRVV
ncbi:hypothetical protein PQX77_012511 [Marasmius sp. AFHP31]|nr:hypothetical protein PQX77_012511 [Marasmius sp. AFHP31]